MVVTCMMTLVTRIGPENQKGSITGIFRSLGALARACGPIVASIGNALLITYNFRHNNFLFYIQILFMFSNFSTQIGVLISENLFLLFS